MGSIAWNRQTWENPGNWPSDGDGWTFHARWSSSPYETWKASVVDWFLHPYVSPEADVVEIGPGHGRWSEYFVGHARSVTLVDVSASCIEACRERLGERPEVHMLLNDGRSLSLHSASADLIWSFGTFVHIDAQDIDAYLAEFKRVLRPGGRFVVHHSGWRELGRHLKPLTSRLGSAGAHLQIRLSQGQSGGTGGRSEMSAPWFSRLATRHGLSVDYQARTWGERRSHGLAYRDVITVGSNVS